MGNEGRMRAVAGVGGKDEGFCVVAVGGIWK